MKDEVNNSRVVHTSVDSIEKIIPGSSVGQNQTTNEANVGVDQDGKDDESEAEAEGDDEGEGEGEGEGELPDHDERSIANTRPPKPNDGILELDELVRMMEALPGGATSALGSTPGNASEGELETFGTRGGLDGLDTKSQGRDEPAYTCFTPLFKLTLGESPFYHSAYSKRYRSIHQQ